MHGEHRGQVPPHRAGTRLAAGVEPVRGGRGRIFKCRMGSTIASYIILFINLKTQINYGKTIMANGKPHERKRKRGIAEHRFGTHGT